jgi:hypothetical protein
MAKPEIRRVYRQFTPQERERWLRARQEIEAEMPQLIEQHRLLREAAAEPTLSGAVRRAVHRAGLMVPHIAQEIGLAESQIHEFLLGERTLRSDVLDRLAKAVGLEFPDDTPVPPSNAKRREVIVTPVPPLDSTPASPSAP